MSHCRHAECARTYEDQNDRCSCYCTTCAPSNTKDPGQMPRPHEQRVRMDVALKALYDILDRPPPGLTEAEREMILSKRADEMHAAASSLRDKFRKVVTR